VKIFGEKGNDRENNLLIDILQFSDLVLAFYLSDCREHESTKVYPIADPTIVIDLK
jgi:hypothetical protein